MILLALWLAVQTPDSATRVRWDKSLQATTDSLDRVRGAVTTFRADLELASAVLVLQRAGEVNTACAGAHRVLQDLQSLLGSSYSPKSAREQADLRSSAGQMLGTLARCQREWATDPGTPARADTVKEWGPYRTAQLDTQVSTFLGVLKRFMKAAGLAKTA